VSPGPSAERPVEGATVPRGAGGGTTSPGRTDRVAVAAEATNFDVAFLTDPVGPKALPGLVAAILVVSGATLALRRGEPRSWPSGRVLVRMAGAVAAFGSYAAILPPLGFVVATTATVSALSMLFGGPWRRSLAAALTLSVVLWYLFVWVLGLPLPLGSMWEAIWMR